MKDINIIGAGLAGSEAAYYLGMRGYRVNLFEMKPLYFSKAHTYEGFAELVCSNSLKAKDKYSASGLLKEELRSLGSLVMQAADENAVAAGGALAVNREKFSDFITQKIKSIENVEIINSKIDDLSELPKREYTIIASGPLTTQELSISISKLINEEYLRFYDAAAPIVSGESIDLDIAFKASRYDKGDPDYFNCPMTKEQYDKFYNELIKAETANAQEFEKNDFFQGCMPIEELAKRGYMTPLFGPMKPVGIKDQRRPNEKFYGVVQLRSENSEGSMYNLVGFQTKLKFDEQKRIFSLIPGLQKAEFLRYGVMHRNTYIDSPKLLDKFYRLKHNKNLFFAGQITGVEGYLESASSGLYCGLQIDRLIKGYEPFDFTRKTCIGALANHISDESIKKFQPMNANFGIFENVSIKKIDKKQKKEIRVKASSDFMDDYLKNLDLKDLKSR